MTEHDPSDDAVMASAYLDGELDPDGVARVESDPSLLAEVELQRQVRALIADVDPPSISRREEHLAAALDAWDRVPATRAADGTPTGGVVTPISTPPPSPAERRAAGWNRRLLGAAAALVVVLGAGAALQVFTQIDDDAGDGAVAVRDADAAGDAATQSADAGDGSGQETSGDTAEESAEDETAAAVAPVDDAELAVEGTIDVGSDNASPPRESDLEQLRGPDDLAIFASDAVGAPVADSGDALAETDGGVTTPEIELPLCLGADVLVGPARYLDEVVVVGIDLGRDLALAYRPDGCIEVARASIDTP